MHRVLLFLLLLPLQLMAQTLAKPRLTYQGCHTLSIAQYISTHPDDIAKTDSGRVLFVMKQRFINDYVDSASGVKIRALDLDSNAAVLKHYFSKKQKFVLLNIQQMSMKNLTGQIWILPTKTTYNSKKGTVDELKYRDEICQYIFDYTPEKQEQYYTFNQAICKDPG